MNAKEEIKNYNKGWNACLEEFPKHLETSPSTVELLDEKYVRKWILLIAFGSLLTLIGVVYNYANQINTELGVYKSNMFTEIGEIKADVREIGTNVDWLKSYLTDSSIETIYEEN